MELNPSDLQYFFETARTLNISRAAERLGVGQPTVSQAIRRLERHFGTALFDRYKTGVRLTAAGTRLAAEGRGALDGWRRLREAVTASEAEIQGQFTIGCHPSVAQYALPPFLKSLLAEHPRLEIQLKHGLSREITEDVVSFRVDFGLVINPVAHPDLVVRELSRDRVGFWAATGALEDTLIHEPSLLQTQSLLKKARSRKIHFKRQIESSSLETIAAVAEGGCGVAILPACVARRFPKLKPYGKNLPYFEDRLCLAYRADRKHSAAARAIIAAVGKARI